MEREKEKGSFLFWFFLLVFLAGAAYLLHGVYERYTSGEPPKSARSTDAPGMTLSISEEKAGELIRAYLEGSETVENPAVSLKKDRVVLRGGVLVEALIDEAVAESMPEIGMVKAVLPERADISIEFSAAVENGEVKVLPEACSVNGYALPVGLVPSSLRESVGRSVLSFAEARGVVVTGLKVEQGRIVIEIE